MKNINLIIAFMSGLTVMIMVNWITVGGFSAYTEIEIILYMIIIGATYALWFVGAWLTNKEVKRKK